jgi:hypothetical protein
MTRQNRLRRVVLLCSSFARNLAYYRLGQSGDGKHLLSATATHPSFWLADQRQLPRCGCIGVVQTPGSGAPHCPGSHPLESPRFPPSGCGCTRCDDAPMRTAPTRRGSARPPAARTIPRIGDQRSVVSDSLVRLCGPCHKSAFPVPGQELNLNFGCVESPGPHALRYATWQRRPDRRGGDARGHVHR